MLAATGATAVAALAGCIGGESKTPVDETVTVDEDRNKSWPLEFDGDNTVSYDFIVRNGPAVDVFIVEESEYSAYTSNERFEYLEGDPDSSNGDGSIDLNAGDYRFVIDNSDLVRASPPTNGVDDPAEVDVTLTIS